MTDDPVFSRQSHHESYNERPDPLLDFKNRMASLEQSLSELSEWPPKLERSLHTASNDGFNESLISKFSYVDRELNLCDRYLDDARNAWSNVGEPEHLKSTIDGNANSLTTMKNNVKRILTDHSDVMIPHAVTTMIGTIGGIEEATRQLDKMENKFDSIEVNKLRANKYAVGQDRYDFKTASNVLDWCTPMTGIEKAESAKLIRDLDRQITGFHSESDVSQKDRLTALKSRYEDWKTKLKVHFRSGKESSDLDDKIRTLKTGLEMRMESSHTDWKAKYDDIAGTYQSEGERLIDDAIAKGNTFVSSAQSASASMSAVAWHDFTKSKEAWTASLENFNQNAAKIRGLQALTSDSTPLLEKWIDLEKLRITVTEAQRMLGEIRHPFE